MHALPSWCNLRGGLDRSACIEIRLSELRQLAGCIEFVHTKHGSRWRKSNATFPLPNQAPALRKFSDGSRRIATGIFTITARQLHELHATRLPRTLAGDYRTSRAHVMRGGSTTTDARVKPSKHRFRTRINRANPVAWPPDRGLHSNPNKGACRNKIIGLTGEWSQPIRIEHWQYPTRIHPVYFLICPGFQRELKINPQMSAMSPMPSKRNQPKSMSASSELPADSELPISNLFLPPLSTRKPGREHPNTKKCPQRCFKLMMVQCTQAEAIDAYAAQLWINSLPDRLRSRQPYDSFIHKLIARYGPIMQPRVLLCPRCLGVHYGNHPETVRQSWRRRNKRPDTTPAANPAALAVPLNQFSRYKYEMARENIQGVPHGTVAEDYREMKRQLRAARKREYGHKYRMRKAQVKEARQIITEAGLTDELHYAQSDEQIIELAATLRTAEPEHARKTKRR